LGYLVIGKPFLGEPNTCCTETYLVIRPFDSLQKCENVISYMRTRFFRFLVLLKKNTQHATSKVYSLVPIQDFNESWTDEKLYKKYGLTAEEITFIESMVRPMELGNE
jgi:site-specific DNA-methyltransferase (adenine-specific)